jgi:hypothetical protein
MFQDTTKRLNGDYEHDDDNEHQMIIMNVMLIMNDGDYERDDNNERPEK